MTFNNCFCIICFSVTLLDVWYNNLNYLSQVNLDIESVITIRSLVPVSSLLPKIIRILFINDKVTRRASYSPDDRRYVWHCVVMAVPLQQCHIEPARFSARWLTIFRLDI